MNKYYLVPVSEYERPAKTVEPTGTVHPAKTAPPAKTVLPTIQYHSTADPTGFNALTKTILEYPGLTIEQRAALLRESLVHFINSKTAAKAEFETGLGKLVKKVVLKAKDVWAEGNDKVLVPGAFDNLPDLPEDAEFQNEDKNVLPAETPKWSGNDIPTTSKDDIPGLTSSSTTNKKGDWQPNGDSDDDDDKVPGLAELSKRNMLPSNQERVRKEPRRLIQGKGKQGWYCVN